MKIRNLLVLPVAALALLGSAAASTPAYADENSHSLTIVCNEGGKCSQNGTTNGKPDPRLGLWEKKEAFWHFKQQRKQHEAQLKTVRYNEMMQARQQGDPKGKPAVTSRQMTYTSGAPWLQQRSKGGDDVNVGNVYNVTNFWVYVYQWGDNNNSNFVAQDNINIQAGLAAFGADIGQDQTATLANSSSSDQAIN